MKPLKNAHLKKRVMATLVSATVAFGGVTVVAPTADADPRITNAYSALDQGDYDAALQYNKTLKVNRSMDLMTTAYGPGWCIDAHLDVPQHYTQFDVRRLDGTSGFYGFNGNMGGDLNIHPDIEKAAINLTKTMLDSYYAGQTEEVRKKNFALQALLSNNLEQLDKMRGLIQGDVKFQSGTKPPEVSANEFLKWTGFEIRRNYGNPIGQSAFFLYKNEQAFSQLKVKTGEYVTVLVPKSYNVYEDLTKEPTNQRIIIIAQPGLEGYEPKKNIVRETVTKTADPVTTTVTRPAGTSTVTHYVQPEHHKEVVEQPTITKTEVVSQDVTTTQTVVQADKTVTTTKRPRVEHNTETYTREVEPTTVTETAPQKTVTRYVDEPVLTTTTKTITPTVTEDAPKETKYVTKTAEPVYKTTTVTAAPKTETATVTAAPKTTTVTAHATKTNVTEVERTKIVERYIRNYKYAIDFNMSEKSRQIEVEKLRNWEIEFVDDSNGLVKVEKKIVNGKAVLEITPVKEGRGTVRIVVVDAEGNRHEYIINVVNEKTEKIVETEAVVNNHYFNVGIGNLKQTIQIGKNWNYEIVDGGGIIDTKAVEGGIEVTAKKDSRGTATLKVYEEINGKRTGNENNYIFNIDAFADRYTQTRVIGNANSYKLEIKDVEEQPKVTSGEDLIQSIEKNDEGFWIITPKPGAEGNAVIEATDKDGNVYTYTLTIKQGTNVLVDVQTHTIIEGQSREIVAEGDDFVLEPAGSAYNSDNWEVKRDGNKFTVTNKNNDVATFNLYKTDKNSPSGRILVGVYTFIAKPAEKEDFTPGNVEYNIIDRNTVKITPGDAAGTPNKIDITKNRENATVIVEDGVYRIMPKPGFEGDIVVEETAQNKPIATYTIHVKKGEVEEKTQDAESNSLVTFSGVKDGQVLRITEGENLVDLDASDLKNGQIKFKPGAEGKVVIENLNSRDLPFQRFIFNVKPVDVQEETFDLVGNTSASFRLSTNFTFKVTEGEDIIDVEKQDGGFVVKPKDGKEGRAVIEVKDGNGHVVYRYIFNVDGTKKNSGNTTINNEFKLTENGTFKITRRNENKIVVQDGSEWVEVDTSKDGEWILTPKPGSVGKTVTVVEMRNDVVVKRHTIKIVSDPKPLNFKEERRVYIEKLDGKINPGTPGNTFTILRGRDLVEEQKLPDGSVQITPVEQKYAQILVEERDPEGNPVRIVELEIPPTSQGDTTTPSISISEPKGNAKDGWTFNITGGSNSVEIKVCNDAKCVPVDPNKVKREGDQIIVDPGAIPNGKWDYLWIGGVENGVPAKGVERKVNIKATINVKDTNGSQKGSSELDGKCIASIVGLSAPLLLAIPLGILSQVRIPGLEGLSAQVNDAIRQANDQIQRGLGIYNEDRSRRAAGFQGAFNVANPEMLSLAAGSLGAITLGLFLIDGVLRACGQGEMTSSYKIGEATGQEWMMYGSSGKSSKDQAEKPSEEAGAKDKKDESKK